MAFTVKERYQAAVISIDGRFLGSTAGQAFREQLDKLLAAGRKQIVVDLSETEFMDSSAIGVLISGLTTVRRAGGDMRLAAVTRRIKGVFVVTRLLGNVFEDYETVDEAIESFQTRPPDPAPADLQE
jgi:anti-sigma B factor antagonist